MLTVRKPGGERFEFLVITMSNVFITSYLVAGSNGSDGLFEKVTLSFDLMDGVYKLQKPDGSIGASIPWSIGPSAGKCATGD